jgi:hypothetical protein
VEREFAEGIDLAEAIGELRLLKGGIAEIED